MKYGLALLQITRHARRISAALSIALTLLTGCIFDTHPRLADSGGSSETTNGLVVGYVHKQDGSSAENVRVLLRTRYFLKSGAPTLFKNSILDGETVTDAQGKYSFNAVEPGDYLIEANDQGRVAVVQEFSSGDKDTVSLPSMVLKPTGVVVGSVNTSLPGKTRCKVQIYGLDRIAFTDSVSGKFSFSDLPEGTYTLHASILGSSVEAKDISGVNARGSDTTDIGTQSIASFYDEDYSTWPNSMIIQMNTTTSGANIAHDVANFPVLIRLNRGNFDFGKSDEHNIRFADPSGKHLRYQIEKWDSNNLMAAIWVAMDTIHGNSHADYITMYYGNTTSQDWSDGRRVFASENGFGGVWHLNEEAPDTTVKGLYQDATDAAQNGDDRITSRLTDGRIGNGHGFGLGDYIVAQPSAILRPAKSLFISAWYRGKATDSLGSNLISLGDTYGLRVEPDGSVKFFLDHGGVNFLLLNPKSTNVLDSAWHYLVASYDGLFVRLYVDGQEKASISTREKIRYTLGPEIFIGRHGLGRRDFDLVGFLDEVQIHAIGRNADWIKLCFESQRLNSTLLEFPALP